MFVQAAKYKPCDAWLWPKLPPAVPLSVFWMMPLVPPSNVIQLLVEQTKAPDEADPMACAVITAPDSHFTVMGLPPDPLPPTVANFVTPSESKLNVPHRCRVAPAVHVPAAARP